jgi:DivIVA domain-containing protein
MSLVNSTVADVTFRSRLRGFDRDEVRAFIGNLAGDYERAVRDLERVKQELDLVREKVSKTRPFPETTTRELEQILAGGARVANEIRGKAEQERQSLVTAAHSRAAGIVKAAEHRASETVRRAEEERQSLVAAADSRAAEIVKDAEHRAGEIADSAADVARASEELREQAERERRSIVDAAQLRGDEIVKDAEHRAHEIIAHAAGRVTSLGTQAETLRAQLLQMRATFEAAADAATAAIGTIAELGDEQESDVVESTGAAEIRKSR